MRAHEIEMIPGDDRSMMWRPLDAGGNFLPRVAITERTASEVCQVRLFEERDGHFPVVHVFDADSPADAGLWASWWCNWEV
jgi:hypothetical protein